MTATETEKKADARPPNTALTLLRRRNLWQYALLALALVYLFLFDPLRNWWTYETQRVEIATVQSLCAAFEKDKSVPLEVATCETLREKMAGKPEIDIRPRTFVTFTYRSPADGGTHTANVVRDLDDAGQPIAIGSRLTVEVSRNDPKVVRVP